MTRILITGAASGIGAAVAKRLAGSCEHMILHTGSNAVGLREVAEACAAAGAHAEAIVGNLGDADTVDALLDAGRDAALTGLVLNAGFPDWRAFEDLDAAGLDASMQVITQSSFQVVNGLAPELKASGQGKVLAVSSFLAHRFKVGEMIVPASATAKAALEAMIKSFAAQYAAAGVCANVIVPGYIKKNAPDHKAPDPATLERIIGRIPAARLGLPEDVAELAAFLMSPNADYITGQCIHIDGGLLLQ